MCILTGLIMFALCSLSAPSSADDLVTLAGPAGTKYRTLAAESKNSQADILLFHDWFGPSEATVTSAKHIAQKRELEIESVLLNLLAWIRLHSSYSVDQIALPEVVELTPSRLTLEAYIDVPELLPASGVDERILGLYAYDDGANGTIYILQCSESEYESEFIDHASGETCEEENLMFQERLLHELVHHVQRVSGAAQLFTCRKFGEKEAYLLGGKFFKSHYFTDPLPNRNILAHMYSRC